MSQRPNPFLTTLKVPDQLMTSVKNGSIEKTVQAFQSNANDPTVSLGVATYLELVSRWPKQFGQQLFSKLALDTFLEILTNQTTSVILANSNVSTSAVQASLRGLVNLALSLGTSGVSATSLAGLVNDYAVVGNVSATVLAALDVYITGFGPGSVTAFTVSGEPEPKLQPEAYTILTTGPGTGTNFTVTVTIVPDSENYGVYISNAGLNYELPKTFTILGSDIGGTDGLNDLTLTLTSVNTQRGVVAGGTTAGLAVDPIASVVLLTRPTGLHGSYMKLQVTRTPGQTVYTTSVIDGGLGYKLNDALIVKGSLLGGADVTNDLTFTVTSFANLGTQVNGIQSLTAYYGFQFLNFVMSPILFDIVPGRTPPLVPYNNYSPSSRALDILTNLAIADVRANITDNPGSIANTNDILALSELLNIFYTMYNCNIFSNGSGYFSGPNFVVVTGPTIWQEFRGPALQENAFLAFQSVAGEYITAAATGPLNNFQIQTVYSNALRGYYSLISNTTFTNQDGSRIMDILDVPIAMLLRFDRLFNWPQLGSFTTNEALWYSAGLYAEALAVAPLSTAITDREISFVGLMASSLNDGQPGNESNNEAPTVQNLCKAVNSIRVLQVRPVNKLVGGIGSFTFTGRSTKSAGVYTVEPEASNGSTGQNLMLTVTKTATSELYSVLMTTSGTGYNVNDALIVKGSLLGGTDVVNDLKLIVSALQDPRGIKDITFTGIAVGPSVSLSQYFVEPVGPGTGSGSSALVTTTSGSSDYSVLINFSGSNYDIGDVLTVKGSLLGGLDDTNDLTITVTELIWTNLSQADKNSTAFYFVMQQLGTCIYGGLPESPDKGSYNYYKKNIDVIFSILDSIKNIYTLDSLSIISLDWFYVVALIIVPQLMNILKGPVDTLDPIYIITALNVISIWLRPDAIMPEGLTKPNVIKSFSNLNALLVQMLTVSSSIYTNLTDLSIVHNAILQCMTLLGAY